MGPISPIRTSRMTVSQRMVSLNGSFPLRPLRPLREAFLCATARQILAPQQEQAIVPSRA